MNDLSVLDGVQDSSEILEIIKLSKLYKLEGLFKAAEAYFQEIMYLWFENYSIFSLKPQNKTTGINQFTKRVGVIQGKQSKQDEN